MRQAGHFGWRKLLGAPVRAWPRSGRGDTRGAGASLLSQGLRRPAVGSLLIALAGVAGLALRIWVYRSAVGIPDSDESVVGLMVRHALHGQLTTFYWGQPYGGSQEVLLTVPVFLVSGTSLLGLRLVPIFLSALTAVLLWRVGRRTIGEPAARFAAALFWVWLPFNLVQITHQSGFYASDVFYCALILLLGLRVVEQPDRVRVGLFGFVLGLAFWQTAQIVPIALPVIGWVIWKQPRSLRLAWLATPLALLGALPWIIWNVRNDWASLIVRANRTEYTHSLRLFVSPLIPMTLGLRAPLTAQLLVPSKLATTAIYFGLVVAFGYGAYRTRRQRASILYIAVFLFPLIWALSRRVSFLSATPRFLIVLTPVIALLAGQLAKNHARAAALLALASVISIVSVHRMNIDAQAVHPHGLPTTPRSLGRLISTLRAAKLTRVYADYWIAYRLDFDSREQIVATEVDPGAHLKLAGGQAVPRTPSVRYPPYEREVRSYRHGFVFFRQTIASNIVASQLSRLGYRRSLNGRFVIYAPRP